MTRKAITIELECDTLDQIAVVSMQGFIKDLNADLKRRKRGRGCAVFCTDKTADIAEIQRHINAFKTVLRYFGEAG